MCVCVCVSQCPLNGHLREQPCKLGRCALIPDAFCVSVTPTRTSVSCSSTKPSARGPITQSAHADADVGQPPRYRGGSLSESPPFCRVCLRFLFFFFAHRAAACCGDVYANKRSASRRGGLHSASLQNTELACQQMLNNLLNAICGFKKKKKKGGGEERERQRRRVQTTICDKVCEIMMTCQTGC